MSEACQYLHDALRRLPRLRGGDLESIPKSGIYVLFERGETAHGGDRIVRVGTHRGRNQLPGRIREHLYTPNKDRSIFRKHVGRCLLAKANDPFLAQWNLDLTSKKSRTRHDDPIDAEQRRKIEDVVTTYMNEAFSFVVLRFDKREDRLHHESRLLSTIKVCAECHPSGDWLGRHHPTQKVIPESGLWNVQGLSKTPMTLDEVTVILRAGLT
jgi:hypothetical protein